MTIFPTVCVSSKSTSATRCRIIPYEVKLNEQTILMTSLERWSNEYWLHINGYTKLGLTIVRIVITDNLFSLLDDVTSTQSNKFSGKRALQMDL